MFKMTDVIRQIDRNERLLLSAFQQSLLLSAFQAKPELVFVLT